MPWKECHVMDERLRFVARLLDGEKMAPLCGLRLSLNEPPLNPRIARLMDAAERGVSSTRSKFAKDHFRVDEPTGLVTSSSESFRA